MTNQNIEQLTSIDPSSGTITPRQIAKAWLVSEKFAVRMVKYCITSQLLPPEVQRLDGRYRLTQDQCRILHNYLTRRRLESKHNRRTGAQRTRERRKPFYKKVIGAFSAPTE